MYVHTVINFAKYHILHTAYRMSDHVVSFEPSSGETKIKLLGWCEVTDRLPKTNEPKFDAKQIDKYFRLLFNFIRV